MEEETTKNITVLIASRPYPLKISVADEPVIRKIVKEVNEKVNRFQLAYTNKDKQDCLSMSLLTYAVDLHRNKQSVTASIKAELSERLDQVENLLDELLESS